MSDIRWTRNPVYGDQPAGRVLVLPVYTDTEGLEGYDCATIPLTREMALALLARLALVMEWKAKDRGLVTADFFDDTAEYRPGELAEAPDFADYWLPDFESDRDESRTYGDVLEVGDGFVQWRGIAKYVDCEVRTAELSAKDLLEFAGGGDPWKEAS